MLVHGCNSSPARLSSLAAVLEDHGQQAVCFDYDDRGSIDVAADELIASLEALQEQLEAQQITVLGHSQGGLVARRALIAERTRPLSVAPGFSYRLVTIASPFGGIEAARDCGRAWLHVISLGLTALVCRAVAGSKWTEIHPGSPLIERPGVLQPKVLGSIQVMTDEVDACRRRAEDGTCEESDFVFGLSEQTNVSIERDPRVVTVQVRSGHTEIVGESGRRPGALAHLLQEQGVLLALRDRR